MPELPEVERVRQGLEAILPGLRVRRVRILRRDVVVAPSLGDPPGGWTRAPGPPQRQRRLPGPLLLGGATITGVRRHGKELAIVAAGGPALGVHLGMTGQLRWIAPHHPAPRRDHVHAVWQLADADGGPAGRLVFRDPRRFGGLWAYAGEADLVAARWRPLGPDALQITAAALRDALAGRRGASASPVKACLLDQRRIAGFGNIYADEALFDAGIDPARPAVSLDDAELRRLAAALRRTLRGAIAAGGSTLRDYVDAAGVAGSYQTRHRVYGRGGLECHRCGSTLATRRLAQRTTVSCPTCQPAAGTTCGRRGKHAGAAILSTL